MSRNPVNTALMAALLVGAPFGGGLPRDEERPVDPRHARLNMEAAQEKRRKRAEKAMRRG